MRLLRWIPLLLAVACFYYLASWAKEVKTDELMAQAPSRLGIKDKDWKHWSTVVSQIQSGHIPDLTLEDWDHLKGLCSSADDTLRSKNIQLLGFLKDTPYRDKAIAISEKATEDASATVRAWALKNLKELGADNLPEKVESMSRDPSSTVRNAAEALKSGDGH